MNFPGPGEGVFPGSALGRARTALAAGIAGSVLLLDQASKAWAGKALAGSPPLTVVENFFHLTYHRNTGGVFGFLSGSPTMGRRLFFILASLLALAFVVYLIREWGRSSLLSLCGLSLVCGGALGNLVDRVRYGEVVDFIDWHWFSHHWPTFNIADSAIMAGTVLLLLSILFSPPTEEPQGT